MSICQKEADQLFCQMQYDKDNIMQEEKQHGKCMRLYQDHNLNRWKFEDGYILETQIHKMVFKDVLIRAWNIPGSFYI